MQFRGQGGPRTGSEQEEDAEQRAEKTEEIKHVEEVWLVNDDRTKGDGQRKKEKRDDGHIMADRFLVIKTENMSGPCQ